MKTHLIIEITPFEWKIHGGSLPANNAKTACGISGQASTAKGFSSQWFFQGSETEGSTNIQHVDCKKCLNNLK